MKFISHLIILIAVQVFCTAFSFAGSFVVKERIPLAQDLKCDDLLVEAATALLPPDLDKLVQYYSVVCDPDTVTPRELVIEAIYEAQDEEAEAKLEILYDSVGKASVQKKALNPIWLREVFLNVYHFAFKKNQNAWEMLAGFEAPQSIEMFSLVYAEKNKLKSFLKNASDDELKTYLFSWLTPKEVAEWQAKVLPQMQMLQLRFNVYLVAQDGRVVKSDLSYQLERLK